MYKLVSSHQFKKALRKFSGRDAKLQAKIDQILSLMENDVFMPSLGTHKLGGKLSGLLPCSCGYDCRIVFTLRKANQGSEEIIILLLDIGTHNDVY